MKKNSVILNPVAIAVALAVTGAAHAVGTGNIVSGAGSITKEGNTTTVQQNSDKMIVDWNNMDVNKSETLNFNQGNLNAAVLNKINSVDPTVIAGALNANGKVFIVNPNGVLISKGAAVNVGSLIASALDISNDDFQKNKMNFKGEGKGDVINEGDITASESVTMLGANQVANTGTIHAQMGDAKLASGGDITLYFPAIGKTYVVINKGSLKALVNNGGIIVTERGTIQLTAWATDTLTRGVINNTGVLEARGFRNSADGDIILSSTGNGDVNVGGEMNNRGQGHINAYGKNIHVNDGTSLSADEITLTSSAKDGYVQLGRTQVQRGKTTLVADNVLTTTSGRDSTFADNVTAMSSSTNNSVTVADTAVTDTTKIQKGRSVVGSGIVDAVAKSGRSLIVKNDGGNININNSQQDFGNLVLQTQKDVNISSQMKGNDLVASGDTINQSAGAHIKMRNAARIYSNADFTQNANITADVIDQRAGGTLTQNSNAVNTGREISYDGRDIVLKGRTVADALNMNAYLTSTEKTGASIQANSMTLNGGQFDLTAGKNSVRGIEAQTQSLSLNALGDTAITAGSRVDGNLNLNVDRNVDLADLIVNGNATVKAGGDVRMAGFLNADNDISITGNNILSALSDEGYNAIGTGGSVTLSAKNKIDVGDLNFSDDANWNVNPALKNRLNATANTISLQSVYGAGRTDLTATRGITLGDMTLSGPLFARTNGDFVLNQDLSSTGTVFVRANNIIGKVTNAAYPWLQQEKAGIAAGDQDLQANNNVDLGHVVAAPTGSSSSGSAKISARNVNVDTVDASQRVDINAANDVNINSLSLRADVDDGNSVVKPSTISGNTVRVNASDSYGALSVYANRDLYFGVSSGLTDSSFVSRNGSVYLDQVGYDGYSTGDFKNLTIKAANKVTMNGSFTVDGDLAVTAGRPGISLPDWLYVTGNAVLKTPGNITNNNAYAQYNFNRNLTYVVSRTSKIADQYGQRLNTDVFGRETTLIGY